MPCSSSPIPLVLCGYWLIDWLIDCHWMFSMLSVPLSSGRTALISALTDLASRPHQRYCKALWVKLGGMITPVTRVLHRGDDCLNVHSCVRPCVQRTKQALWFLLFVWWMQTEMSRASSHALIGQPHSYSVQYCVYIRCSCIDHHSVLSDLGAD